MDEGRRTAAEGAQAEEGITLENENLAEQVQTWQAQRMAMGENPNDWEAFRAHLEALGAPDPGEEPVEGFSIGEEIVPRQQISDGPLPRVGAGPKAGGSDSIIPPAKGTPVPTSFVDAGATTPQANGAVFNPETWRGMNAQQIINNGFNWQGLSDEDKVRLFPFRTNPQAGIRNFLRGYGFDMDIGNDYTEHLESELNPDLQRLRYKNILAGKSDNEKDILGDLPSVMTNGVRSMGGGLTAGGNDLLRRYAANPEGLTKEQRALAENLKNEDFAFDFYSLDQDSASDLNSRDVMSGVKRAMMERYRNLSPGFAGGGKTFLDFISGGGR